MPAAKKSGIRRRRSSADDCDDLNNRLIVPAKKPRVRRGRISSDNDNRPYLPHEVVLVNILQRLPVKTLMRCSCVCRLWYNSIKLDTNFASSHLAQSLKNPPLMFCYLNINPVRNLLLLLDENKKPDFQRNNRKIHHKMKKHKDCGPVDLIFRYLLSLGISKMELVGSCNGLVCLSQSPRMATGMIVIINPSRFETLCVIRRISDHGYIFCYGFGFDSITNEYKVVLIVRTIYAVKEFKCMIFTLGNNSWRETSTSPPIGDPPLVAGGIRAGTDNNIYKSAIFCGGTLFWRTKSDAPAANEHMLLSFNLHDEQFQAIPLPDECYLNNSTEQHQVVDPLIEFRGSPCVPHLEIIGGSSDYLPQHYGCKVHLHILKDKVEKVWIKETLDVHISSSSSASCCFHDATTPTRILSSFGRVLLYWFNGKFLQIYDLHTKHFKVVKRSPRDKYDYHWIFKNKIHSSHPEGDDDDGGNLCHTNYQLNYHVENFLSFQTFIPKGASKLDLHALNHNVKTDDRTPKVFLFLHKLSEYYILN